MALPIWGSKGCTTTWSVSWDRVTVGARVDVVGQPICVDSDGGLFVLFPGNTRVRIIGFRDLPEGTDAVSIFGALVESLLPIPVLRCDEISLTMHFPAVCPSDFRCMTEVCVGIGVATFGFSKLGIRTVAVNELRPALAEMFRQLHEGVPVTVGDLALPEVVHDLWFHHRRSTMLFGGFACQPFSKGGQQHGANDMRSNTLSSTLKAGLMLRAPVILLECVPEAASNAFVRHELANFCKECQFHMAETFVALEDCWVSKRARWWVVLSAKLLGPVHLPAPPTFPFPSKVAHVLPRFIDMMPDELDQLLLTEDEYRRFRQFAPSFGALSLSPHGKAPTALHSWGSQVVACRCGCRKEGFSDQLLAQRGIYGILVPCAGTTIVDGEELPSMRHIHPVELALLTCVPTPDTWTGDLRLGICGLGQQATPLQALWVAGLTLSHVDRLYCGATDVHVWHLMEELRHEVLSVSKKMLDPETGTRVFVDVSSPVSPVVVASSKGQESTECEVMTGHDLQLAEVDAPWKSCVHTGGEFSFTRVDFTGQNSVEVSLACRETTVHSLIVAEKALHPDVMTIECFDCMTGSVLDQDEVINGKAVYLLTSSQHDVGQITLEEAIAPTCPDLWLNALHDDGYISPSPCEPFGSDHEVASPKIAGAFEGSPYFDGVRMSDHARSQIQSIMDSSEGCADPLCRLLPEELIQVSPPPITSMFVLDSICRQEMPVHDRLRILEKQSSLWSDDEIRFHVRAMIQQSGRTDIGFVDPLLAAEIVRRPQASLLHQWVAAWQGTMSCLVTVVWIDGHWIPLFCTWTVEMLHVSSWDNTEPQPRALTQFCDLLSKAVGSSKFMLRVEHRRFPVTEGCGVCAVRFIDHQIRGRMLPTDSFEVSELHFKGRAFFLEDLAVRSFVPRPWLWGNGLDSSAKSRLSDLLSQHGVPDDQLDTRIHLIAQSIGLGPLQKVLVGSNPWRSIKSLANACKPPVQLVLAEELQKQVDKRMQQGSIGKKSSKRKAKPNPVAPVPLDPLKLAVDNGVFVRDDGSPLRQLSLSQIGPFAEGVVIANLASAGAYLRADQVVNKLALGLILLDADEKDLPTRLKWQQVRVALRCAANGEPMLVVACLVQLGDQEVSQSRTTPVHDFKAVTAACIKAAVYRDVVEGSWEAFCRSPIRYILGHLSPLQTCEKCQGMPDDDCPFWHAASDETLHDPVLDVWRRQWLNLQFRPVAQEEASIFIVNLRFVHSLEERVLRLSGHAGLFLEPRTVDSRDAHLDYQVLWMPKANQAEIERLCRTNPMAVGIARLGSRYGLRVFTKDASTVGQQVKPGSIFLASGTRLSFEVGPLPFGYDRLSLSKIFSSIGWQARPLHTVRTLPGLNGAVWLVQSCVDPPTQVIPLKHGDVVVSKLKSPSNGPTETCAPVVTSSATLELCQLKDDECPMGASNPDPWLVKDPWSQPIMKMKVGNEQSEAALKQVEARVEQTLLAKIPTLNTQGGEQLVQNQQNESRFQALESQLQQLSTGHQLLETRVEEQGRKHEAQLSQFQHQVSAQMEAQSSQMETLFRQQMASIEDVVTANRRSRSKHE